MLPLTHPPTHSTHFLLCTPPCRQVPALNIFETSFRRGKFDASRKLSNGTLMDFAHIYPMDAVFDTPEDVPEEVGTCFREGWSSQGVIGVFGLLRYP